MPLLDDFQGVRAALSGRITLVDRGQPFGLDDLHRRADALAASLLAHGCKRGDRIAVVMQNSAWVVISYLGTWKSGATIVAMNPTFTVSELRHQLELTEPVACITEEGKLADVMAACSGLASPPTFYLDGTAADAEASGATSLGSLPLCVPGHVEPARHLALVFTSGTTGRPKAAALTDDGLRFALDAWRSVMRLSADDAVFCGVPLFHVYGLILVMLSLTTGNRLILERGFPMPQFLDTLERERVTIFPSVPPVFQLLASAEWRWESRDFSSLRLAISAAAPLAPETLREARRRLHQPRFCDGYGISETSTIVAMGPIDEEVPPGSCGKPVEGVEVRIIDRDGNSAACGAHGEITIRTPGMMAGYFRDEAATREAIVDGWYRSGDVGYVDERGFLYITDRLKDVIFVAGVNVYPREIEDALLEHPRVTRAAVTRMKYEATGEAPIAYVVFSAGPAPKISELLAFLRDRLAPCKLPKKVVIMEDLPTTASGKVLRHRLTESHAS